MQLYCIISLTITYGSRLFLIAIKHYICASPKDILDRTIGWIHLLPDFGVLNQYRVTRVYIVTLVER